MSDDDPLRDRLIRDGFVVPARMAPGAPRLEGRPVPCSGDAVRTVIEERGER